MKMKATILVSITILTAAAVFQAVRQARAQAGNTFASRFVVVDSVGRPLGPVIGVQYGGGGNLSTVALPVNGRWLPVDVQRTSFLTSVSSLLFVSTNCTGQPYEDADFGPWPEATAFGSTPTLYAESGPNQAITSQSYLNSQGNCYQSSTSYPDAVPVSPAIDLSVYKPPFSVVSGDPYGSQ